jgi:hypothetical protein
VVAQVAGNPIPVLQRQHALVIGAGVGMLQDKRGMVGERGGRDEVGLVEAVPTAPRADRQVPRTSRPISGSTSLAPPEQLRQMHR